MDALDVAFVTKGALKEFEALRKTAHPAISGEVGIELMQSVLDAMPSLEAADAQHGPCYTGAYVYEVAEPFGAAMLRAALGIEKEAPADIAQRLTRACAGT